MKYGSVRTWSELCGRWFASKLEARRGEELHILQMGRKIADLEYQVKLSLSEDPKVFVVLDFRYRQPALTPWFVYEDAKGVLTAAARIKYAWLKQLYGIDVVLWRG